MPAVSPASLSPSALPAPVPGKRPLSLETLKAPYGVTAILVVLFGLALMVLPAEDSSAFLVGMLCTGLGLGLIALFTPQPLERKYLMRLFLGAYLVRLVFTYAFYKAGLEPVLGGADATVWDYAWYESRYWWAWQHHLSGVVSANSYAFPDSLVDLFTVAKRNSGYNFFITVFYFLLNVQSQLALAFFNCFGGACTAVMVYKTSRLFFSMRASLMAATWAALLPGLLIWSALTEKEVWVICFQIASFYCFWRALRSREPHTVLAYLFGVVVMVLVLKSMRFYISYLQIVGVILTFCSFRSRKPGTAALVATVVLVGSVVFAAHVGILKINLSSLAEEQISNMMSYQSSMATGPGQRSSSVVFNYDIRTPGGFVKMLGAGSVYLLFSPFIWQITKFRQASALPDVFLWYYLAATLVIPGGAYMWRKQRGAFLSLVFYFVPLVILYSLTFANVGLAFRQRGQFMPFVLVLAAAGYESRFERERQKRNRKRAGNLARALANFSVPGALRGDEPGPPAFPSPSG